MEGNNMILRGTVFSRVLEMNTGINVVVPNRFDDGEPYQICYLLHGLCGGSGDYSDNTLLPVYAENYRSVFIMPEVSRSFYTDMKRGQQFFSYVADELPRICRRVFNISALREDTMVAGASMGGYGALKCALRRPEQYGWCAAFSSACLFLKEGLAAMRTPEGLEKARETYGEQLCTDFLSAFGDDLAWHPGNDIMELAQETDGYPHKPRLFVACGEDDYLLADNRRFRTEMERLNYDFTYAEWPGEHNWVFFDAALRKALEWRHGGGAKTS